LTAATARALRSQKGTLHLPNFKRIPARIATILAEHRGHLEIEIHSGLPEQTLLSLIRHRPAICFDNLTRITPAIARALAERRINHLCEGLEGDFEEACQAVADDDPWLCLDRLNHLSAECARKLAKHPGPLSLKGLTEIDVAAGRIFTRRKEPVCFGDAISSMAINRANSIPLNEPVSFP
jgi:hypothetical protein